MFFSLSLTELCICSVPVIRGFFSFLWCRCRKRAKVKAVKFCNALDESLKVKL